MGKWVVLKFGGTSVSTKERWQTIAEIVAQRRAAGERPFVVCSALSGISNQLEALVTQALAGAHAPVLKAIEAQHHALAADLNVDPSEAVGECLATLSRLATGISLVGEASPRVRARMLAQGELMSTRLGAAFLTLTGVDVQWRDARTMLTTIDDDSDTLERRFISARCEHDPDSALQAELSEERTVITQGFIASTTAGETALLGRGGSDTSAAYFAARLLADRCEIWTDVPGMYTANPRDIPSARLLNLLDYDEAQEIATTGAKVLHPRCIAPLRAHRIPLHIRCTPHPHLQGTVVSADGAGGGAQLKAVSSKSPVTLISMDTVGMWQQVGFLADIFACFKRVGLSVDLVSTSEMNVTVSLDPAANALDSESLARLERELAAYCKVRVIAHCAAVSLVGRRIRAILHQLGDALDTFEEHQIHLVSQAASDLNLTFVVDHEHAERVVRRLHAQLLGRRKANDLFGPSWEETFATPEREMPVSERPWWWRRRSELIDIATSSGATYVYDQATLHQRADELLAMDAFDGVFFAMKANPNPEVLATLHARGVGFECVSPGELRRVRDVMGDSARIIFTPNFADRSEYELGYELGATVTLDNVQPLRSWPEVFAGRDLMLRVDPGEGRGHHDHVKTAGVHSKFGIAPHELAQVAELASAHSIRVVGLHAHSGSGILDPGAWREVALCLIDGARKFDDATIIDVGGGLGVPGKPGDKRLDLEALNQTIKDIAAAHPGFKFWTEPGRYLVAEAGVLLARVTQTKVKEDLVYIGLETGMNSLIRPALYGAWHEIVNLSQLGEQNTILANVVGPICETGDTLGYGRALPHTREGDVMLIGTAGAYGRAMSSHYNLREPAAERLLEPSP